MDSPARPTQQPKMASSTGGTEGSSPASSPASAASLAAMATPKFGTLVPNRIFVGGISASTSEAELAQVFSAYGNVKATKIIADRGGVSKGYGFVTFETEEEAKRLQNESECIILRERKLNIAPAIKKQSFNRNFDGGTGSPTTVPANTYYYTNGMNLTYQNGIPVYNTGAPAPGTALAVPSDPTGLYQAAAGVFGPQATAGHQTFTPMVYPVPAPSLYMPQQYPYSPMPYEPYFAGTAGAAGAPFIYTTNGIGSSQTPQSGGANGSASSSGNSPASYQSHLYGAGPGSHHPLSSGSGGSHQGPPPPQMELYYSYPSQPTHAVSSQPHPPPHHVGPMSMPDQQLMMYSEIAPPQAQHPNMNDAQMNHEEPAATLSHQSEQQQQHQSSTSNNSTCSEGGGGSGLTNISTQQNEQSPSTSSHTKYSRYSSSNNSNFHPVSHVQEVPLPPGDADTGSDTKVSQATMHYRGAPVYPAVYMPPYPGPSGASLLPTPSCQPQHFEGYSNKYPKSGGYGPKQSQPLVHASTVYVKPYASQAPPQSQKYPRVSTPPGRLQQLGRRPSAPGPQHPPQLMPPSPATFYIPSQLAHKPPCQFGGGPRGYLYQQPTYGPGLAKGPFGFDYNRHDRQTSRRPNHRGGSAPPSNAPETTTKSAEAPASTTPSKSQSASVEPAPAIDLLDDTHSHSADTSTSSTTTPPHPTHSPSPTPSQVQIFSGQQHQRFNNQQQRGGRSYASSSRGGGPKGAPRQPSKYKLNGIVQPQVSGKQVQSENAGGDAPTSIGRLPLTPPGTPQQQSPNSSGASTTEQQVKDSCHQMQALSL